MGITWLMGYNSLPSYKTLLFGEKSSFLHSHDELYTQFDGEKHPIQWTFLQYDMDVKHIIVKCFTHNNL